MKNAASFVDQKQLLSRLTEAYKQINAPRSRLGRTTLTGIATKAAEADDVTYAALDQKIKDITDERNEIAGTMLGILEGAVFEGKPADSGEAEFLIAEAAELIASAQ